MKKKVKTIKIYLVLLVVLVISVVVTSYNLGVQESTNESNKSGAQGLEVIPDNRVEEAISIKQETENIDVETNLFDTNSDIKVEFNEIDINRFQYNMMESECDRLVKSDESFDYSEIDIKTSLEIDIDSLYADKTDSKSKRLNIANGVSIAGLSVKHYPGLISDYRSSCQLAVNLGDSVTGKSSIIYYNDIVDGSIAYFDNMIIKRYVNPLGTLKTLCSIYDDGDIVVFNPVDLDAYEVASIDMASYKLPKKNEMSENEFIAAVYDSLVTLLNDGEVYKTSSDTDIKCFITDSGIKEALNIRNYINENIGSSFEIYLKYNKCGMSSLENNENNRVFMQIDIYDEESNENKVLNLILKLDETYRVFDIDMI